MQLEWVTSIPWPSSAAFANATSSDKLRDRGFLTDARKQLDEDHYGLEKIKKRLIEYLAVVRLKQLQAEHPLDADLPPLVPAPLPAPSANGEGGNGDAAASAAAQRSEGDAIARALALISKALKLGTSAEPKATSDLAVVPSPPSQRTPGPRRSGSGKAKRGPVSKAVKGPILL